MAQQALRPAVEAAVQQATKASEETQAVAQQALAARREAAVQQATKASEETQTTANKAMEIAHAARLSAESILDTAEIAELREANTETQAMAQQALAVAKAVEAAVQRWTKASEETQATANKAMEIAGAAGTTLNTYNQSVQKLNVFNSPLFQSFNRRLSTQDLDRLLGFWAPLLDLHVDRRALGYLAHRICLVEDTCSGRLATSVQDAVLRVLLAQSIPGEQLSVLEIGALFGVNLAALYETCHGRFAQIHLTAIDPLEGYYDKGATDLITKVPVESGSF